MLLNAEGDDDERIVDGLQCARALVQAVLANCLTGFDLPPTVSLVADCIIDVETSALVCRGCVARPNDLDSVCSDKSSKKTIGSAFGLLKKDMCPDVVLQPRIRVPSRPFAAEQ